MNVGERIKQRRKDLKMSADELATSVGVSRSTIFRYEKGDIEKVGPDVLKKIAVKLNVSPANLMGWDDTPIHELKIPTSPIVQKITEKAVQLSTPRKQKVLNYANEQLKEQNNKVIMIEENLFEYRVFEKLSAGTGFSYFNDGNYDTVFYDKDLDHDFASWVFGDSMEPKYMNGEVVLIKETGFDYDGAIYAVDWDGQTYIKKVYKEKDGLRLVSINNKYKDKFAPFEEDPRIIGKIVGNFMPIEN
nr:MAG TPA_asm: Repressor protein CI [Caudoviricetes sp.]